MKKLLILFVLTICLLLPIIVFGDIAEDSVEGIEFQGAKIVSEGAYFYIEIINHRNTVANLTFYTPILFEERPYPYQYGSGYDEYFKYLILEPGNVTRFHFHAPIIDKETKTFKMKLKDNEDEPWVGSTLIVKVVDMTTDLSFEMYRENQFLQNQNNRLKEENKQLKDKLAVYEPETEIYVIEHPMNVTPELIMLGWTIIIPLFVGALLFYCGLKLIDRKLKSKDNATL